MTEQLNVSYQFVLITLSRGIDDKKTIQVRLLFFALFISSFIIGQQNPNTEFFASYNISEYLNKETYKYELVKTKDNRIVTWEVHFDKKNNIIYLQDSVTKDYYDMPIDSMAKEKGNYKYWAKGKTNIIEFIEEPLYSSVYITMPNVSIRYRRKK